MSGAYEPLVDDEVEDFVREVFARDVAAYLLDRADQYKTSSPCWIALSNAAANIIRGEVQAEKANGTFDAELYARVDAMRRSKVPESWP